MFMYVFPICIIIISNILYQISSKSIPPKVNPFSSLIITYLTAALVSAIAFNFYKTDKGFFQSFKDLNWTSIAPGIAIVGIEFGYIIAYRAGWNISIGSLVASISLSLFLIPIGMLFFKEAFGINKILGMVICIVGLILINKK